MLIRDLGRWLCMVAIAGTGACAVASCGSGNNPSQFGNGQNDSGSGDDSTVTPMMDSGGGFIHDGGTGCKPKTCAALGYSCGDNSDGCGHVLQCGTCTAPEFCGGGGFSKCGGNNQMLPDGGMVCTPKTSCGKDDAGVQENCGFMGDGCGGPVINCGTCTDPQFCGGGGFNVCGGNNGLLPDGGSPCTPTDCNTLGYDCGYAGDGCGHSLQCGNCTSPQYCGGGGFNKCGGNNGMMPDGGGLCTPTSCAVLGYTCGFAADGCGNTLMCGSGSCPSPQFCGGGGFNKCGGNTGLAPDGAVPCTPLTCTNYAAGTCGAQPDGCGGVTANCGTCVAPQTCGGGGTPSRCGGNTGLGPDGSVLCTPTTCLALGYTCGSAGDGCGGLLSCGTCTDPQYCGGGGYDLCGGNNGLLPDGGVACTPKTCAQLNYNCGQTDDGCGNIISCGNCILPQFCGGGGFDLCGPINLAACDAGSTTLSGYVYDPGNNLPVYNALVYVPVGAVQVPQTGVLPVSCGCSAPPAYASAYTGIDGSFTLINPPSGAITVVVQLGKWQRSFSETVTACKPNVLGGHLTLPSTHQQGNIPRFAIDTGAVDTMECVLLKMGIAQSEFVDPVVVGGLPTAVQRIHMYKGSIVNGGAVVDGATPGEAALTETASVMDAYDVVLFPCQGGPGTYNNANGFPNTLGNLLTYTKDGGRAFTTHYHYDLLDGNGTFNGTANWAPGNGVGWNGPFTGNIDQSFARGSTLAQWLHQPVVYGGTLGQIPVNIIRNDFTAVNAPAQRWMYTTNPPDQGMATMPIHYTFDTPFGQTPTCGRVVYSDFHVENAGNANGITFPNECAGGGLTAQEKLLEFMIFDLTSCVGGPPACIPLTCSSFPAGTCGVQGDGCGGVTADCGNCVAPQTCGGGGTPNQCGYPDSGSCQPQGCPANIKCGPAGNGCGGVIASCGTCTPPQTCGGGGVGGQCGYPDAGMCVPQGCPANITCGPAGDGCGGIIASCGTCTPPQTCGGGGTPGQCGYPDSGACHPLTCANFTTCGVQGDGCGGETAYCNPCTLPQTCGGGGTPGVCGGSDGAACMPETCSAQNITCGPAGDGCGNLIPSCGTCTPPQTCGGGGVSGHCGAPDAGTCTPVDCQAQGISCGPAGDGCGNELMCGPCTPPQTCGGGGVPGKCGALDGGMCMAQTCASQHISCGPAGDGCGNLIQCGNCVVPQTCGGGGVAGQCGGAQ